MSLTFSLLYLALREICLGINIYGVFQAYRLLISETEDMEVYKLNNDQRKAIGEARQQIMSGQFLTDEQSNKEIDEWLNK